MIAMISFVIGIIARDTARMGMWIDPERGREVNSSDEEDPPDKCN